MARRANAMKRQEWADRLERFARANQTVAAFCRNEGVSAPSFYQWKRKLSPIGDAAHGRVAVSRFNATAPPRFKPVQLTTSLATPAAIVRLPGGASIELAADCDFVGTVVDRLLAAQDRGGEPC